MVATAAADPDPDPAPPPAPPATDPAPPASTTPPLPSLLFPGLLVRVPAPPRTVSLRVEAARIANQRFEDSWRFPDADPAFGMEGGLWFMGPGRYQPLSPRSAALHGGSMAATLLGEILLSADSPLAAGAALLTGATLDAAAAEADQAAEARR